MSDEKRLCPKTLTLEIWQDGSIVANGAPCIQDRCMAWQEIKYECTRPDKEDTCEKKGSCYTDCELWKPKFGCKIIEGQP